MTPLEAARQQIQAFRDKWATIGERLCPEVKPPLSAFSQEDYIERTVGVFALECAADLDRVLAALAQPGTLTTDVTQLVREALNSVRWIRVQCGACGSLYQRCVGCRHGVRSDVGISNEQCGGHTNTPCSDACLLQRALAALASEGEGAEEIAVHLCEKCEKPAYVGLACLHCGAADSAARAVRGEVPRGNVQQAIADIFEKQNG